MSNKSILEKKTLKRKWPEQILEIYIYLILCIHPLIFWHYYKDIIDVKYYYFVICSITLMVILAGYSIAKRIFFREKTKKDNEFHIISKARKLWKDASFQEKVMVFFMLVTAISTFQSDYFFESFWGNEGRLTGLFLTTIYGICFLIVGRLGKLKVRILDAMLLTGNLVCLFGITDYFQLDILGFKENIVPSQIWMFTSTIGNINLYTIFVAMITAVAMILFISEKKERLTKKVYYYITMVIAMTALLMGQSDNAYLSIVALFGLSPLYLFRYKWGIRGYAIAISSFMTVILAIHWMDILYQDTIKLVIAVEIASKISAYPLIVAACWIVTCLIAWALRKGESEEASLWWRRGWIALICIVIIGVLFVLYDCNVAGNAERYGNFQRYVLLNERWGTNRGFIWSAALEVYGGYPWYRKLVGFGPDTFGLALYHKYLPQMLEFSGEIYDSAHNEYIQYLVTLGAAGLLSYLALMFSSIRRMWKNRTNPYVMAILFALLCYWFQATVNINQPITGPIVWTLWGLGLSACARKEV